MRKTTLAMASAAVATAMAGVLAAGTASAQSGPSPKPEFKFEKCYGVAKAAKNDCQTATHSCAGQSKKDMEADAWIYVPAGVCARIVNGSTEPKKA